MASTPWDGVCGTITAGTITGWHARAVLGSDGCAAQDADASPCWVWFMWLLRYSSALVVVAVIVVGVLSLRLNKAAIASSCGTCLDMDCVQIRDWWTCNSLATLQPQASCTFLRNSNATTTVTCPSVTLLPQTPPPSQTHPSSTATTACLPETVELCPRSLEPEALAAESVDLLMRLDSDVWFAEIMPQNVTYIGLAQSAPDKTLLEEEAHQAEHCAGLFPFGGDKQHFRPNCGMQLCLLSLTDTRSSSVKSRQRRCAYLSADRADLASDWPVKASLTDKI